MIIAGANALNRRKPEIDAMNVFPVPDGDTGTNMSFTVLAAARETNQLSTPNISDAAKAASGGALRGARGNSGVILSQLFRGFAKGLDGVAVARTADLAKACAQAVETAYKAVMKPKEGTILTIARAISEQAAVSAAVTDDIETFMEEILAHADKTLAKTPEMLPELRQAGVEDAGGKGLLVVLEGALRGLRADSAEPLLETAAASGVAPPVAANAAAMASGDIHFAYCTEFFVHVKNVTEEAENHFKQYLESTGDSIVAVADEELIKIHVHTNHPGSVLEKALLIGSLSHLKIENMRLQHTSLINFSLESKSPENKNADHNHEKKGEKKDVGFAAVSLGGGFKELFLNLGVDEVIEGGQTMNPSAEDILRAVERINAAAVFILPNNKNIILAAEQAAQLCADKTAVVLPTRSIPQGLTSVISYAPAYSLEENQTIMRRAMEKTRTGQVTRAVRNTKMDGQEIHTGDCLCMLDGKIISVRRDPQEGAKELINRMITPDVEIIGLYYGAETSEEQAQAAAAYARERYPEHEVEVFYGGQPVYHYIISAE
jgi:DAK2 domain fusion protein YloV